MQNNNYARSLWQRNNSAAGHGSQQAGGDAIPGAQARSLQPGRELAASSLASVQDWSNRLRDPFADAEEAMEEDLSSGSRTRTGEDSGPPGGPVPALAVTPAGPGVAPGWDAAAVLQPGQTPSETGDLAGGLERGPEFTTRLLREGVERAQEAGESGRARTTASRPAQEAVAARDHALPTAEDGTARPHFEPSSPGPGHTPVRGAGTALPGGESAADARADAAEMEAVLAELDRKMERLMGAAGGTRRERNINDSAGVSAGDVSQSRQLQPRRDAAAAARPAPRQAQVTIGSLSVEIIPAREAAAGAARPQQRSARGRGSRQGRISGKLPSSGRFGAGPW